VISKGIFAGLERACRRQESRAISYSLPLISIFILSTLPLAFTTVFSGSFHITQICFFFHYHCLRDRGDIFATLIVTQGTLVKVSLKRRPIFTNQGMTSLCIDPKYSLSSPFILITVAAAIITSMVNGMLKCVDLPCNNATLLDSKEISISLLLNRIYYIIHLIIA